MFVTTTQDAELTFRVCYEGHAPIIYIESVSENRVPDRASEYLFGECPVCASKTMSPESTIRPE